MARPNLIDLVRLKLIEAKPGPRPKFRGMICCPGEGVGSKAPYGVTTTPGSFRSVAKAGRSLKYVSPLVSRPVVMLKGGPELATPNKFTVNARGTGMLPPKYVKLSEPKLLRANSLV